jgi:hypothetical protein
LFPLLTLVARWHRSRNLCGDTAFSGATPDGTCCTVPCAETAHTWAKAIIDALDAGAKFTPEMMVNYADADVWMRELAEALASSNGVKQY